MGVGRGQISQRGAARWGQGMNPDTGQGVAPDEKPRVAQVGPGQCGQMRGKTMGPDGGVYLGQKFQMGA